MTAFVADSLVSFLDCFDSHALVSFLDRVSLDIVGFKLPSYLSMYNGFPHLSLLAVVVPLYLAALFVLKRFVKSSWRSNPFVVNYAFYHNAFMAALSLFMLVDCLSLMAAGGAFSSIHNHLVFEGDVAKFSALYDIFYWSKYLELIDTFVLVVKQKPLDFLHLFHHCTTASVAYVSRFQPLCLGVWTNSFVHVLMYIHFARPIPSLRSTITTLQITQFLWVLALYFHWFMLYSTLSWTDVLYQNACYGVYLVFFCQFFYANYISPTPHTRRRLAASKSD